MTTSAFFHSHQNPVVEVRVEGTRRPTIKLRLCVPGADLQVTEISLGASAWRAILDELMPVVEDLEPGRKSGMAPMEQPADERVLLPIWPDAARALRIGRTKLFQLIGDGEIETVKIGRRVLIPADALDEYVQRLRSRGQRRAEDRP
jgi:excisionase family DNA binding protein